MVNRIKKKTFFYHRRSETMAKEKVHRRAAKVAENNHLDTLKTIMPKAVSLYVSALSAETYN